jgi:hypothetical protein
MSHAGFISHTTETKMGTHGPPGLGHSRFHSDTSCTFPWYRPRVRSRTGRGKPYDPLAESCSVMHSERERSRSSISSRQRHAERSVSRTAGTDDLPAGSPGVARVPLLPLSRQEPLLADFAAPPTVGTRFCRVHLRSTLLARYSIERHRGRVSASREFVEAAHLVL